MPRPSHLSTDNILRFLQLRNDPVSLEELSRALHVKKGDRRPLLQMLAKLKTRGLVEELSHGPLPFPPHRSAIPPPLPNLLPKRSPSRKPLPATKSRAASFCIRMAMALSFPMSLSPMWMATFSFRAITSKTPCTAITSSLKLPASAATPAPAALKDALCASSAARIPPSSASSTTLPAAALSFPMTRESSTTSSF